MKAFRILYFKLKKGKHLSLILIQNMQIEHEINRFNEKRNPRQIPLPMGHVQSHRGKIHTESI